MRVKNGVSIIMQISRSAASCFNYSLIARAVANKRVCVYSWALVVFALEVRKPHQMEYASSSAEKLKLE